MSLITEDNATGTGSASTFNFTFEYVKESDVFVSVDDVVQTLNTHYTFAPNTSSITFLPAHIPANGAAVRIFRETSLTSPSAEFFPGSAIRAQDLNANNDQVLFSAQERKERSLDTTGGNLTGQLDMQTNKIVNLGTPTANTDAVTKQYVDDADNLKLNLAGGTMSGDIAMGTNKVTGLGTPSANNDATTKTYVDTADNLKLNTSGGTMSGPIAMGGSKVTGLGAPTANGDAATKQYVDGVAVAGISDGDRGDINVSNSGGTWTIDNGTITSAKMDTNIELQGTFSATATTFKGTGIGNDPGQITLNCDNNNHGITIKSPPHALNSVSYTLQLPVTLPTQDGHALKSDLSGNLSWGTAGGASGGGTDQVFYEHDSTITTSYTIGAGKNVITAGPITQNAFEQDGVTPVVVTVPSTSNWVIV